MVRTSKNTKNTSTKSNSSSKKTVSKSKKKTDSWIASTKEKEALIWDMKQSMQHLWKLPSMIMAPIIAFVSSQYEKIPKERRKKLGSISKNMKEWSHDGLESMKDWFKEMKSWTSPEKKTSKSKKKTTAKKATTKKISSKKTKPSSLTKKTDSKQAAPSEKITRKSPVKKTVKKTAESKKAQPQDRLTKIDGLSIKAQRVLRAWGVDSYEDLSKAKVWEIRKLLAEWGVEHENSQTNEWKKSAKLLIV